MQEIRVSSKGQIVVPKYMREAAGMAEGSVVIAVLEGHRIILTPKPADPVEAIRKAGNELSIRNIRRDIREE